MRKISSAEARTRFSALLDEVARGETVVIMKRGRPVARLAPPEAPDRRSAVAAARILRDLRKRVGWATTEEILELRNEGRR
jgi:prevent-host-death family protein